MKNRLEEIRKARGQRQEELADALEVSRQTIRTVLSRSFSDSKEFFEEVFLRKSVDCRILAGLWEDGSKLNRLFCVPLLEKSFCNRHLGLL